MANSNRKTATAKPKKPHKDFPLFPHANGQWAKKVKGKLYYFGPWDDADGAIQQWIADRDDLLARRKPRSRNSSELTVKGLLDAFLTGKLDRVKTGELSLRTYEDYLRVLQHVADEFGKNRLVTDLAASDFAALRQSFAERHGPVRLSKDVTVTRMAFRWGFESGVIERPIKFGPDFKQPDKKVKRKAQREKGRKDFDSEELRRIVDAATMPLRAMILLGINCGFGNTDVSTLSRSHIDLEAGWIVFPRPKTEVDRRCPLWPETVQALRDTLKCQPAAKNAQDADRVFLTERGTAVVRVTESSRTDWVSAHFTKLTKLIGLSGKRGFYSLRHSFRTVADEARDPAACDLIMGHSDNTMASNYRHHIRGKRLRDVVGVVRAWLWPTTGQEARHVQHSDIAWLE